MAIEDMGPAAFAGEREHPAHVRSASDLEVVIPTLGREILSSCLGGLIGGSILPDRVIVVHQGDDSRIDSLIVDSKRAGLPVTLIRSSDRGRARGLNLGIAHVRSRFVAITDDDCLPAADWVERMADLLRQRPEAIVTGRVESEGDEPAVDTFGDLRPAEWNRPRLRHDSLCGGNMGAALEVLREVGPFDEHESIATAEDCEYSYRALRRGVPILYDPEILVRHLGWRLPEERAIQYESYARSYSAFLGRYLRRRDPFIVARTVVHLGRSLRRWALGRVRGDVDRAASGRAYVRALVPGLFRGWRSEDPCR